MHSPRGAEYRRKTNRDKKIKRFSLLLGCACALSLSVFGAFKLIAPAFGKPSDPTPTDPVSLATATPGDTPGSTPQAPSTAAPSPTPPAASGQEFSDAVFIGDSRTAGLELNGGLSGAKFLCGTGLTIETALTKPVSRLDDGSMGTVIQALGQANCQRVYVMFGVNELGWPYTSVFKEKYAKLIRAIQQAKPQATIYVQSILPISQKKSDSSDIYKQSKVNTFNKAIEEMAREEKVKYLNVAQSVAGSDGYLPEEASSDGIHLSKAYCKKWIAYLRQNAK